MTRSYPCGCDFGHGCADEQRLYAAYESLYRQWQGTRDDADWMTYKAAVDDYRRHFTEQEPPQPASGFKPP